MNGMAFTTIRRAGFHIALLAGFLVLAGQSHAWGEGLSAQWQAELQTRQQQMQAAHQMGAGFDAAINQQEQLSQQLQEQHRTQIQQFETVRLKLVEAQAQAQGEIARLGPRRMVGSGATGPREIGGPLPETQALVNAYTLEVLQKAQRADQINAALTRCAQEIATLRQNKAKLMQDIQWGTTRIQVLQKAVADAQMAAAHAATQQPVSVEGGGASSPPKVRDRTVSDQGFAAPAVAAPAGIPASVDASLRRVTDWSKVYLIADDGTFLGHLGERPTDAESIHNEVGIHGSTVGAKSIYNTVSQYGGAVGQHSPFNNTASRPPRLFVEGAAVCVVTVKEHQVLSIDPAILRLLPRLYRP